MEPQKNTKKPANGLESSAFGTAMLGNFKPEELGRRTREISLGNFEPTNKKQTDDESEQ